VLVFLQKFCSRRVDASAALSVPFHDLAGQPEAALEVRFVRMYAFEQSRALRARTLAFSGGD